MIERFARFPAALASRTRAARLGRSEIPALLAHPEWEHSAPTTPPSPTTPAPVVIWMHGRTVSKEIDPGRYLRWVRAGIAACAVDLPGHGERATPGGDSPARTLDVLEQMVEEIDEIIEALADPRWEGAFDLDRMAIGGMSAGGMATLRRLCDPHPFVCAAVEGTTGNLAGLYHPEADRPWPVSHPPERVHPLDPMRHLEGWRPIPLLDLHSEADRVVPVAVQREFIGALGGHYESRGANPAMVELVMWPETGAPEEHAGFGRYSNDAKNMQTEFFARHLLGRP